MTIRELVAYLQTIEEQDAEVFEATIGGYDKLLPLDKLGEKVQDFYHMPEKGGLWLTHLNEKEKKKAGRVVRGLSIT